MKLVYCSTSRVVPLLGLRYAHTRCADKTAYVSTRSRFKAHECLGRKHGRVGKKTTKKVLVGKSFTVNNEYCSEKYASHSRGSSVRGKAAVSSFNYSNTSIGLTASTVILAGVANRVSNKLALVVLKVSRNTHTHKQLL